MDSGTPDLSGSSRIIKFVRAQSPDPDHSSSRKFVRAQSPDPDQSTLIANLAIDLVSESENEESKGNSLGLQESAFQEYAHLDATSEPEDPFGHLGNNLD